MDQLICASLSHINYYYEVGILKVPVCVRLVSFFLFSFSGDAAFSYVLLFCTESTLLYVFLPDAVSLPCDEGWILTSSCMINNITVV